MGGAVALVRVSGPNALEIGATVVRANLSLSPGQVSFTSFSNGDEGYVFTTVAPKTYTGEDTVEFSLHGSEASVQSMIDALIAAGARLARPGEFTERRFLNGKIDLSQAEAVADSVESETKRQFEVASQNRQGALSKATKEIENSLLGIITILEAHVDFSEDLEELDMDEIGVAISTLTSQVSNLIKSGTSQARIRQGVRVVIAGRPNAGKSSLLNAILEKERSIVSSHAGTTRDYIEEALDLSGYKIVLYDTAGLRDSNDEVESFGIALTNDLIQKGDLIWYVYDNTVGISQAEIEYLQESHKAFWTIANKCDLSSTDSGIHLSAKTGEGISELKARLLQWIAPETEFAQFGGSPYVNQRHEAILFQLQTALFWANQAVELGQPNDIVLLHLREALSEAGLITGETTPDEILNEIFSRFCLGK